MAGNRDDFDQRGKYWDEDITPLLMVFLLVSVLACFATANLTGLSWYAMVVTVPSMFVGFLVFYAVRTLSRWRYVKRWARILEEADGERNADVGRKIDDMLSAASKIPEVRT